MNLSRLRRAVNGEPRERGAAILLIVTSVVWLHQWLPALLVAAFVLWVLLHQRLEGDLGQGLLRRWRQVWPPRPRVLVPLLLAATLAYWIASVPITAKIMPVTLNFLALSMLLFGNWWRLFPFHRPGPRPLLAQGCAPVSHLAGRPTQRGNQLTVPLGVL